MSKIDLGPRRDIVTEEPAEDGGWYGPFHDPDFALKVFRKLRRQQKYKGKPRLLTGLGDQTVWLEMPASVVEEAIRRSPFTKYRNCKVTTKWWFKPSLSAVSVWPMEHRDESLNRENNWGEDE
jgi:hypothetical protein